MLRGSLIVVAAALVALTGSAQKAAPAKSDASSDVRFLMSEIRRIHPNPFHATPEPVFQAAADDLAARAPSLNQDQLLVELMRFVNLLGERDGHSGIFTLDSGNARTFHVYPLYLYKFSDGLFVVTAPKNKGLVGSRLLAIDGMPVDGLEQKVRPLVPRDNEATRTDRFMSFMLTGEVLHGLGLRPGVGPARFTRAEARRSRAGRDDRAGDRGRLREHHAAVLPDVRLRAAEAVEAALSPPPRPGPLRDDARARARRLRRVQPRARLDRARRAEAPAPRQEEDVQARDRGHAPEPGRRQPHLRRSAQGSALEAGQQEGAAGRADRSQHVLRGAELHHRARAEDPRGLRRRDLGGQPEPVRRRPDRSTSRPRACGSTSPRSTGRRASPATRGSRSSRRCRSR